MQRVKTKRAEKERVAHKPEDVDTPRGIRAQAAQAGGDDGEDESKSSISEHRLVIAPETEAEADDGSSSYDDSEDEEDETKDPEKPTEMQMLERHERQQAMLKRNASMGQGLDGTRRKGDSLEAVSGRWGSQATQSRRISQDVDLQEILESEGIDSIGLANYDETQEDDEDTARRKN